MSTKAAEKTSVSGLLHDPELVHTEAEQTEGDDPPELHPTPYNLILPTSAKLTESDLCYQTFPLSPIHRNLDYC